MGRLIVLGATAWLVVSVWRAQKRRETRQVEEVNESGGTLGVSDDLAGIFGGFVKVLESPETEKGCGC